MHENGTYNRKSYQGEKLYYQTHYLEGTHSSYQAIHHMQVLRSVKAGYKQVKWLRCLIIIQYNSTV